MEGCSRSWKSVHDRGEGGRRLEIDREADCVFWGFRPWSAVDAEREDLHVEAEAAYRAAGEQSECPGARARLGVVDRGGLEVPAGGTRGGDQRGGSRDALGGGARAARVRVHAGDEAGNTGRARLRMDPRRAQAPPTRNPAAAVGKSTRGAMALPPTGAARSAKFTAAGKSV